MDEAEDSAQYRQNGEKSSWTLVKHKLQELNLEGEAKVHNY